MTQIELERKIENTREDLNAAIAGNMTKSRILDISRLLDQNGSRKGTEDEQALYMGKGRQKGC